jgi:hypothetical protein
MKNLQLSFEYFNSYFIRIELRDPLHLTSPVKDTDLVIQNKYLKFVDSRAILDFCIISRLE